MVNSGNYHKQPLVSKPIDSINFGQDIEYKTESGDVFVNQQNLSNSTKNIRNSGSFSMKDKFTRPNINFGSANIKDQMQTVSMQNSNGVVSGSSLLATKQDANKFASQMRNSNFKVGSILPEHNKFQPSNIPIDSSTLGMAKKRIDFKQAGQSIVPVNNLATSAGNNISKGQGDFKTINQSFVNWIQPRQQVNTQR